MVVKRRRTRVGSSTVPPVPSAAGQSLVWAIDFPFDSTTDAALAEWAGTRTGMLFIPLGEPWRTPFIESSNGRLRDECLDIYLSCCLTHAKLTIGDWKEEYNHDRPHSSLGYRTPRAYAAICTH